MGWELTLESVAQLRIVPATEKEIPLILQFVHGLAEYEKLVDRVETTEARVREHLFGAEPIAFSVLAYLDQEAVGFALYFYTYGTFVGLPGLYLEDLFVKPGARGKGIGRSLLQYLAQVAKKKGCWRIEWAVLHWNTPAIQFYESLGAAQIDEWAVYRLSGEPLDKLAGE